MKPKYYTPEEDDYILQKKAEGWTSAKIAQHLGRSRNAVDHRYSMIKPLDIIDGEYQAPQNSFYSNETVNNIINEYFTRKPIRAISAKYGASETTIYSYIRRAGLSGRKRGAALENI